MIVEGESGGGDPEDAVVAAGDRSEFLESGRGSPCGAKERSVVVGGASSSVKDGGGQRGPFPATRGHVSSRRRRLTLALAITKNLLPRSKEVNDYVASEKEIVEDVAQRRSEGRDALSRIVKLAAVLSQKPKPVHGADFVSKFWSSGADSDSDESIDAEIDCSSPTSVPAVAVGFSADDGNIEISTPELVEEAIAAGYTVEDLFRAEEALGSGKTSADRCSPLKLVSDLVQRKGVGKPWQGPLPAPRISPPRTLGDCVAKATYQRRKPQTVRSSVSSPVGFMVSGKKDRVSKKFELEEPQCRDPDFPPLSTGPSPAATASPRKTELDRSREGVNMEQGLPGIPEKVQIGPGKYFRPTRGLCFLFARTGTKPRTHSRHRQKVVLPRAKRTFAEVVRRGKVMAN